MNKTGFSKAEMYITFIGLMSTEQHIVAISSRILLNSNFEVMDSVQAGRPWAWTFRVSEEPFELDASRSLEVVKCVSVSCSWRTYTNHIISL